MASTSFSAGVFRPMLQLGCIPHPASPSRQVPFFRNWCTAVEHLRDHLLTAPECFAWAIVAPDYRSLVDPDDAEGRFRYVEQARTSQGASAQALYDLYRETSALDARDAATLHWFVSVDSLTVGVGTSGICLLIEESVLTAFLPGQGDPQATLTAKGKRTCSGDALPRGLPRERGMRSGRGRTGRPDLSPREQMARERRQATWSELQRIYYEAFRPSIQYIRQAHHAHRDMLGRSIVNDYARLKDVLPRRKQLQYEHWRALRCKCREAPQ